MGIGLQVNDHSSHQSPVYNVLIKTDINVAGENALYRDVRINNIMQHLSHHGQRLITWYKKMSHLYCFVDNLFCSCRFMGEGGWNLIFEWLGGAVTTSNNSFIKEILEVLIMCPIHLERLKECHAPRTIKGLSKECEDSGKFFDVGFLAAEKYAI